MNLRPPSVSGASPFSGNRHHIPSPGRSQAAGTLLLLPALLLPAGAEPPAPPGGTTPPAVLCPAGLPARLAPIGGRALRAALAGGPLTVVLAPGDRSRTIAYRRALESRPLPAKGGAGGARVLTPGEAMRARPGGPMIIAGALGEELLSCLPAAGEVAQGPGPGQTLIVSTTSPWDESAPMLLLVGSDDDTTIDSLTSGALPPRGDFELRHGDLVLKRGWLRPHEALPPAARDIQEDLRGRIRWSDQGAVRVGWIEQEISEEEAQRAAALSERLMLSYAGILGCPSQTTPGAIPPRGPGRLELFVHADRERKVLRTGDPRPTHAWLASGRPPLVHLVRPDAAAGPAAEGLGRAAVWMCAGPGIDLRLAEGAASFLAGEILGRDLSWWEEMLGRLPPDSAGEGSTWLADRPHAALEARRRSLAAGPGRLAAALAAPGPKDGGAPRSRKSPPAPGSQATGPTADPRAARAGLAERPAGFQKGMGLAHMGYGVTDGYGSGASAAQMAELRRMGVEWIALTPFAFMEDPARPEIEFLRSARQSPGMENDYAIMADIASARALGLKVTLKPQIWLGHGSWPGEIAMTSEKDWRAFFDNYREFLTHYALLGSAAGADLLVVGVEMVAATRARQDDWRSLIAHARRLFDGPLTYAAHWGEAAEAVRFWDLLDYVGVDCYYPLSDDPGAAEADLLRGAERVAGILGRIAARAGRPLLITEAGFPALSSAWVSPHDEATGRPEDAEAQARGYRALLTALWDRPWLAGIYWWKWPTTPAGAGRREPLFSPRQRPASDALREWYLRPRRAAAPLD